MMSENRHCHAAAAYIAGVVNRLSVIMRVFGHPDSVPSAPSHFHNLPPSEPSHSYPLSSSRTSVQPFLNPICH
jgi:hypothetical protein